MKKVVIFVVGIGLFLSLSILAAGAATTTPDTVACEGNVLRFPPSDRLDPMPIGDIKFDLGNVPPDRKFVVGKIYRVEFGSNKRNLHFNFYTFFTKWDGAKVEMFYFPVKSPGVPTLDCQAGEAGSYACKIRGALLNPDRLLTFRENGRITMKFLEQENDLVPVGEVPVPPAQSK